MQLLKKIIQQLNFELTLSSLHQLLTTPQLIVVDGNYKGTLPSLPNQSDLENGKCNHVI